MNGAAGGCAAGFIAGVRGKANRANRGCVFNLSAKSLPMAVGACAAMGTMIGTFSYAGNVCIPIFAGPA
jgi:hypothetical protein